MKFKVIIKEGEDGWYVAEVTLPRFISQGRTKNEALENIKEAIELYLESEYDLSFVGAMQVAEVIV